MLHMNYIRTNSCNRCGQCCQNVWPETWPEEFYGRTQDWLDHSYAVPALLGIPSPECLSGEIEIDGYKITYYWDKGLRKSKDNYDCPFLVYEENSCLYACILHRTRYEFWAWNCGKYPNQRMSLPESELFLRDYPKCSYCWIPEEDIANQTK